MKAKIRIPFIVRDGDTDTVTEQVPEGAVVEVLHGDGGGQHKIMLDSGVVCSVGTSRLEFLRDSFQKQE